MSISLANLSVKFLERPNLSQNTVRSYEGTLMPLLFEKGSTQISELTRQELEEYLNSLTHLSYTTHNRHQATIQALLNFGVEQGYLSANPIAKLKRRKPDKEKGEHLSDETIRYLTPEQLQILYTLLKTHCSQPKFYRLRTVVILLHQTGARISEVLDLDLDQVNLTERKFQVIGKGNKQRWCYYSETLTPILDNYLQYYRHQESPSLFTAQQPKSKKVSRLSYRTAYQNWQEIIEKSADLKGFRLHDLRHTFATERVGLMQLEELRALMGHEKIETTLRYQKVTSVRAMNVAQKALTALTKLDTESE